MLRPYAPTPHSSLRSPAIRCMRSSAAHLPARRVFRRRRLRRVPQLAPPIRRPLWLLRARLRADGQPCSPAADAFTRGRRRRPDALAWRALRALRRRGPPSRRRALGGTLRGGPGPCRAVRAFHACATSN